MTHVKRSLSSLSPDQKSVYSLDVQELQTKGEVSIVRHALPLSDTKSKVGGSGMVSGRGGSAYTYAGEETAIAIRDPSKAKQLPKVMTAALPKRIVHALLIDEPLGLICGVAASSQEPNTNTLRRTKTPKNRVTLTIYSAVSVWTVRVTVVDASLCIEDGDVSEPFEEYLVACPTDTRIVRVRAPVGELIPPGSLAMLVNTTNTTGDHRLVLHHGDGTLTHPLQFHDNNDDDSDPVVDFALLESEFAVLMLHTSGSVYAASPILFDGTALPTQVVRHRVSALDPECDSTSSESKQTEAYRDAKWRQQRAARQWMTDVFGDAENNGPYATASLFRTRSSASWPVQRQGPLLSNTSTHTTNNPTALSIEPLRTCTLPTTLLVIGSTNGLLQFVALPPIEARFGFESDADTATLDLEPSFASAVLETVRFDQRHERGGSKSGGSLPFHALLPDPISSNLVHCADEGGVFSVSHSLVSSLERALNNDNGDGDGIADRADTRAWSCLTVGSSADATGMVLSEDARLGHVLVARLSNGDMEAVNVTAAQYLNEASLLGTKETSTPLLLKEHASPSSKTASQALAAMESIPPFYEVSIPLIQKAGVGLSSVGKLVGGSTQPCNIQAGMVATLIDTKSKLERNVVLPLRELFHQITQRTKLLEQMYASQALQLAKLKGQMDVLRQRQKESIELKKMLEGQSALLCQRSAGVLETSRDLLPTITQAEYDYFQQLKRWETTCESREDMVTRIQADASNLTRKLSQSAALQLLSENINEELSPQPQGDISNESRVPGALRCRAQLTVEQKNMCQHLLTGQATNLTNTKEKMVDILDITKTLGQQMDMALHSQCYYPDEINSDSRILVIHQQTQQ